MALGDEAMTLAQRGVQRVVLAHCDHFEPYQTDGSGSFMSVGHVRRWLELLKQCSWSRAISVFFSSQSFILGDERDLGVRENPARMASDLEIQKALVGAGVDQQIHIHHECWPHDPEANSNRLSSLLGYLVAQRADLHLPQYAAFVHGCWSLNASDPAICDIVDEIAVLHRHGVIADFSFPPGRRHCAPTIPAPHTVVPFSAPKGYAADGAKPRTALLRIPSASQLAAEGRFLIWNSPTPFSRVSLDAVAHGDTAPADAVVSWLEESPVIGGTLYIKTHAHSLWDVYWRSIADTWTPVANPRVARAMDGLTAACAREEIPVCFADVTSILESKPMQTDSKSSSAGGPRRACVRGNDVGPGGPDSSDPDLDAFDAGLLEAHRSWFAENPGRLAIDGYYKYKMDSGSILDANDRGIVRWLARQGPRPQRVLEVGAGHAQLALALAALGFPAVAVDIDPERARGARYIQAWMARMHPRVACNLEVLCSTFPDGYSGPDYDMLVATNVINEHWRTWEVPEADKLRLALNGRDAVIDVERWWIHRPGAEEQAALVDGIRLLGYEASQVPVPELSVATIWGFRR